MFWHDAIAVKIKTYTQVLAVEEDCCLNSEVCCYKMAFVLES